MINYDICFGKEWYDMIWCVVCVGLKLPDLLRSYRAVFQILAPVTVNHVPTIHNFMHVATVQHHHRCLSFSEWSNRLTQLTYWTELSSPQVVSLFSELNLHCTARRQWQVTRGCEDKGQQLPQMLFVFSSLFSSHVSLDFRLLVVSSRETRWWWMMNQFRIRIGTGWYSGCGSGSWFKRNSINSIDSALFRFCCDHFSSQNFSIVGEPSSSADRERFLSVSLAAAQLADWTFV